MKKIAGIIAAGWMLLCATGASAQYGKTNIADLVLIYQGGAHRPMEWNKDQFRPYVVHESRDGKKNWLFDGFLFLEFKDGKGRTYAPGYEKTPARRQEWEWLLDRQFEKNKAFDALDQCIAEQKKAIGKPGFKHRLVVTIPVPIRGQKDWGNLNGKDLDFGDEKDRLEASKWYMEKFLERFKQQGYKNITLDGFYWVDESVEGSQDLLVPVGDYIRSKKLKLYWIPYFKAKGYDKWKDYKFDFAYLQPNHFFNAKIEDARIDQTCEIAKAGNMGVEMEFDSRALNGSKEQFRNRLYAYIDGFAKNGAWKDASIAYYEGGNGVYLFSQSKDPKDKEAMDYMADFIIKRKKNWKIK
ncbi:DUF4855 domain-containing protein [Chitinophaga lutea]